MRFALLLSVPLVLLAGCDNCGQSASAPPATTSVTSAPPLPAPAPAPAPSASVAASGKMAHCPDAVPGAKTAVKDVPAGVELSITASDAAAVADIRARTHALLAAQKNQGPGVRHTGNGEGGGLLGRCPVVLKDTLVTAADIEGGSKVTVAAKDAQEVDWLRRETRDRQEELATAGSPAGAGKMSHCPSAVLGATTALKDTPAGVTVTVTASDAAAVEAIRDRAKHLAEIAAADAGAAAMTHTGEGGGGGGIGRCPVVVKDTTLKVKDVAGGSEIDVKAKGTADVKKLQDEAKERAAKFQLPAVASAAPAAPSGPPGRQHPPTTPK